MKDLLVVEDSPMVMKVLKHVLSSSDLFGPSYAMSYKEASDLIENPENQFFAALVDLNLPDAPNGEVVDYVLQKKIPCIVLTGSFDEKRREKLLAKGIVDYVTKEGRYSYIYALGVLGRLVKNQSRKVLVVDDSATARAFVKGLLELHLFEVIEAEDGVQAIKLILEHPDISLMITDFNMPRMDGCELVKHIRVKYEKTDLVIIGLSSEAEGTLSARFIKNGANDFLRKPFNHEEFYCRISHNLELLELIDAIKDASYRDDLTGIYNRKFFFDQGVVAFDDAKSKGAATSAAIIDLDGFEQVNELVGNEGGDYILTGVAQKLSEVYSRFLFSRAGGNVFYVLMAGLTNDKAVEFVEKVRQIVCSIPFDVDDELVKVSYSAGVSSVNASSLDELLKVCSSNLRRAKEAGGDLVFGDD